MADYLTRDDVDNDGPELINVTQRAALQALSPHLTNLQQQNAELQQRLAVDSTAQACCTRGSPLRLRRSHRTRPSGDCVR